MSHWRKLYRFLLKYIFCLFIADYFYSFHVTCAQFKRIWHFYPICKSKRFCSFIALRGPSVQCSEGIFWGKTSAPIDSKHSGFEVTLREKKMFHSKLGQKEKVIFMLSCICRITSLLCWLKFEHMSYGNTGCGVFKRGIQN